MINILKKMMKKRLANFKKVIYSNFKGKSAIYNFVRQLKQLLRN